MRLLLLLLPLLVSAQTITFSPQPFSRIPGLQEIRVYVSMPQGGQVQGMQVVLEALHQNIRIYSYPSLTAYVQDYNKRSWLRWVGIGMETATWATTSGTALESIKIKERWAKAAIAGAAGLLTIGRTLYDREYRPVAIPSDLMQPLIAVPAGQAVEFSVFAQ